MDEAVAARVVDARRARLVASGSSELAPVDEARGVGELVDAGSLEAQAALLDALDRQRAAREPEGAALDEDETDYIVPVRLALEVLNAGIDADDLTAPSNAVG